MKHFNFFLSVPTYDLFCKEIRLFKAVAILSLGVYSKFSGLDES